jgi:hypothetical protein
LSDLITESEGVSMVDIPTADGVKSHTPLVQDTLLVDRDWQVSLKAFNQGKPTAKLQAASAKLIKVPELAWKAMQRGKQFTVTGYTLTVTGICGGVDVSMLLDTGAANTIISPRTLSRIPEQAKPFPVLSFNYQYASASPGNNLEAQGLVMLPMIFGSQIMTVTCVIADIDTDMILGADFVVEIEASLCFRRRQGTMYFQTATGRGRVPIHISSTRIAQLVQVDRAVTLNPGEEIPVPV